MDVRVNYFMALNLVGKKNYWKKCDYHKLIFGHNVSHKNKSHNRSIAKFDSILARKTHSNTLHKNNIKYSYYIQIAWTFYTKKQLWQHFNGIVENKLGDAILKNDNNDLVVNVDCKLNFREQIADIIKEAHDIAI